MLPTPITAAFAASAPRPAGERVAGLGQVVKQWALRVLDRMVDQGDAGEDPERLLLIRFPF